MPSQKLALRSPTTVDNRESTMRDLQIPHSFDTPNCNHRQGESENMMGIAYTSLVLRKALLAFLLILIAAGGARAEQGAELFQEAKHDLVELPMALRSAELVYIARQEELAGLDATADYKVAFELARSQPGLGSGTRQAVEIAVLSALKVAGRSGLLKELMLEAEPATLTCLAEARCTTVTNLYSVGSAAYIAPDARDHFDFLASVSIGTFDSAGQDEAAKIALDMLTPDIAESDPAGVAELAIGCFELGRGTQATRLVDMALGQAERQAMTAEPQGDFGDSTVLRVFGMTAEIDLADALASARNLKSARWRPLVMARVARMAAAQLWRQGHTVTVLQ